jgi:hypothetical protein
MLLRDAMPGKSHTGPLPPLSASQKKLSASLKKDLTYLAGQLGERNSLHYEQLQRSHGWIAQRLKGLGYSVRSYNYSILGKTYTNIEAQRGKKGPFLVVGAHYDSVAGSPGANDNGSGTVALLALAERLKTAPGNFRLVFFPNEEPPYFVKETMGSLVYARMCQKRGDNLKAMLSLETLGYYSQVKGSQKYPMPLSLTYPSTGNFVAFIGNFESGPLVQLCVGAFREAAQFPSEGAALPANVPGVGWSDHWSFWEIGVPGVMVTDTAPFRYPHYHLESDTPDKVDYDSLARVVEGLEKVIRKLL